MTFTGTRIELQQAIFNLDKETLYDIKIEKHRDKRGLQANKYAWKLMTEIGRKMTLSKEEIYTRMLSDYGMLKEDAKGECIEGYFDIDVDLLGVGSYWKFIEYVTINNEAKKKCYLLKGSSEYNSKEMYDFIQGIEQEAKALGIETLSERELRLMIEEMEKEERL